jgi:hypothetical protein
MWGAAKCDFLRLDRDILVLDANSCVEPDSPRVVLLCSGSECLLCVLRNSDVTYPTPHHTKPGSSISKPPSPIPSPVPLQTAAMNGTVTTTATTSTAPPRTAKPPPLSLFFLTRKPARPTIHAQGLPSRSTTCQMTNHRFMYHPEISFCSCPTGRIPMILQPNHSGLPWIVLWYFLHSLSPFPLSV